MCEECGVRWVGKKFVLGKCCRRVAREYNVSVGFCISMEGIDRGGLGRAQEG